MSERIWLKNYPAGMPAEIDADRFRSIPDMFDKTVAKFSDKAAYNNFGHTLSYATLDRLSRNFAAFLQGMQGMGKGERVAIMFDSGAKAIVIIENFARTLEEVLAKTSIKHVITTQTWSSAIACRSRRSGRCCVAICATQ